MDAELMEKLSVQIAFEKDQAETLKPLIDEIRNSVVKMFLSRVMLDSMKHANMLQAIIDLGSNQVIWYIDKQKTVKELKKHIRIEEKMLKNVKGILNKIEDQNIMTLLKEILADEERHHRILTRLMKITESIDVSKDTWEDLYRERLQEEWPDF